MILLSELNDNATFYSSLMKSDQMDNINWEDLVPLVLHQEEWFLKQASGIEALYDKRGGSGSSKENGSSAQLNPHPYR